MIFTKLSIQKLQDSGEADGKKPSHSLVASDDKYENKTMVGKLWTKTGTYGKFLSGQLDSNRTYEGKEYKGYVLITRDEYDSLIKNSIPVVKVDLAKASTEELNDIFN